ncbi:MAG: DNA-binding response regulator, partial [Candidatus Hydrogenedentota bacterium]
MSSNRGGKERKSAEKKPAISILLIDDHELVRIGLKKILEFERDFEVIGEAGEGEAGVRLVEEKDPDVVLLDLNLGGPTNGFDVCRRIARCGRKARVIVLTIYDQETYRREAALAGAVGYLLKDVSGEELAETIRAVVAGENLLEKEALVEGPTLAEIRERMDSLTERERQVLEKILEGLSNKE